MNVLFAHDHRFVPVKGEIFTDSQFEADLWPRYLEHFDGITVCARESSIPQNRTVGDLQISSMPGVEFSLLPNISTIRGQLLRRGWAKREVSKLVADVDAVIARLPSQLGLLAADAARRQQKPYAIEVAGCPWDGLWNYGTLSGKLYAPVMYARTRAAVSRAPYVLYVTREFLQRRYPPGRKAKTTAISNVELGPVAQDVLARKMSRLNSDDFSVDPLTIGLIGTLRGRFKGIQVALEALSRHREKMPSFEFRILGGGGQAAWREMIDKLGLSGLVRLDGTLPGGEAVWHWLDDVDLYIQPSLKEGLPRALIEAMSRACPAIASTAGGMPELLSPSCLARPGNADDLAARMLALASDRSRMMAEAERNWQEAKKYSADELSARRRKFWGAFAEYVRKESHS